MDALMMNKYFHPNMFHPCCLSRTSYYFTIEWTTGKEREDESLHRLLLLNVITLESDRTIATFSFARCRNHNYNFTLFKINYDQRYYNEKQEKYFDLFLPISPGFVNDLKEQYYDKLNI